MLELAIVLLPLQEFAARHSVFGDRSCVVISVGQNPTSTGFCNDKTFGLGPSLTYLPSTIGCNGA
jgi:hypothetical protein